MLSKRAVNAMERVKKYRTEWNHANGFAAESIDQIKGSFGIVKHDYLSLRNAGQKTLDEILELHETMTEVWG